MMLIRYCLNIQTMVKQFSHSFSKTDKKPNHIKNRVAFSLRKRVLQVKWGGNTPENHLFSHLKQINCVVNGLCRFNRDYQTTNL